MRALVGGRNWTWAVQHGHAGVAAAGSSVKPFVWATALENGATNYQPATVRVDGPFSKLETVRPGLPKIFESYSGPVTLRYALRNRSISYP